MNSRWLCKALGPALSVCALAVQPGWGHEADLPLLWRNGSPEAGQGQPLPAKKPWVIREREITFDSRLLAVLKDAAARPHSQIFIELFQGPAYELDVMSTVSRLSDLSTVRGTLKSTVKASWSMAISGNVVNGTIQIGERLYKIEHVFNGRHRLLEVDPAKMPAE